MTHPARGYGPCVGLVRNESRASMDDYGPTSGRVGPRARRSGPAKVGNAVAGCWQTRRVTLNQADVVRRLAYIRYLHTLGAGQARQPQPASSAAVLMWHDAVESWLVLACEFLGAGSTREFESYWKTFAGLTPPVVLPVQTGMTRLNKFRVGLKHHGGHPSPSTIETMRADVGTFLSSATQQVFGFDYETATLSSLIQHDQLRECVQRAEAATVAGDLVDAAVALVDAWHEFESLTIQRHKYDQRRPVLSLGPQVRERVRESRIAAYLYDKDASRRNPRLNEDIAEQLAEVTRVTALLQETVRIGALGVDHADYRRFIGLLPVRHDFMDGHRDYRAPEGYSPDPEDVQWCTEFVIDVALRLAAAEAQLDGIRRPSMSTPWVTLRKLDYDGNPLPLLDDAQPSTEVVQA